MRYISKEEVLQKLDMPQCITLMEALFAEISKGNVTHKLRSAQVLESGKLMGIMPGVLPYANCIGTKVITVFHHNYEKGLPSHQGIISVFCTDTGTLKGIVDGTSITAIRTAAASAMATKLLANSDCHTLALLGAGVQAKNHLKAISLVKDIKNVNVWSQSVQESQNFIDNVKGEYNFNFTACETAKKAVEDADIICTLTPSKEPILYGEWVKEGAHINAVGACQPKERELSSDCVKKAKLFGDSTLSVLNESGDYLFPLQEGVISESHYLGEIGDVLTNKIQGRTSNKDITIFESLGVAVEDLACANWLLN